MARQAMAIQDNTHRDNTRQDKTRQDNATTPKIIHDKKDKTNQNNIW